MQSKNQPCKYKSILGVLTIAIIIFTTQSSCQTYSDTDCNHQHQRAQLASRQQRQFNLKQINSPTVAPSSGQQQQAKQSANLMAADQQSPGFSRPPSAPEMLGHQQEEFSLSVGGVTSSNQQQQANYTMLPQQQVVSSIERPLSQSQSLIGLVSNPAARESPPEGASSASNTTPPLPSDTIGSPVVLQPPATTTSSIPSSTASSASKAAVAEQAAQAGNSTGPGGSPHAQEAQTQQPSKEVHQHGGRQQQATGRRMEKSDDPVQRGHFNGMTPPSNTAAAEQPYHLSRRDQEESFQQAPHYQSNQATTSATGNPASEHQHLASNNSPQPVSGSPSSISIITPLIGPMNQQAQQQQQHTATLSASIGTKDGGQQQSMMKPIFVLGNPISERDYSSSSLYYHQYPKEPATSGYPAPTTASETIAPAVQLPKAAKGVDMHQLVQQQDQQMMIQQEMQVKTAQLAKLAEPAEYQQQQHVPAVHSGRADKAAEANELALDHDLSSPNSSAASFNMDRMSGPPLVYSDGHLSSVPVGLSEPANVGSNMSLQQQPLAPASPRLLQTGAAVLGNNLRRPSLPPPVSQANAASGFRSPLSPSGPLGTSQQSAGGSSLQAPVNGGPNFYQSSPPYAGAGLLSGSSGSVFNSGTPPVLGYNKPPNGYMMTQANSLTTSVGQPAAAQQQAQQQQTGLTQQLGLGQPAVTLPTGSSVPAVTGGYSSRRPLNITRVERK